jgi:SsrA-binding protein
MSKEKKLRITEIRNRKAGHEFFLEQKFTAGVVLTGPEVKSVRLGNANMSEAFCLLENNILIIRNLHISGFQNAGYMPQDPLRDRLLLLNKKELKKIGHKMKEKGYALIPVRLFFSESGYAKIEIALAKGKKLYDKRHDLKQKDLKREMEAVKMVKL